MAKLLRIAGAVWIAGVLLSYAATLVLVWMRDGFGAVREVLSPFNWLMYLALAVAAAPGAAMMEWAERIEKKRGE